MTETEGVPPLTEDELKRIKSVSDRIVASGRFSEPGNNRNLRWVIDSLDELFPGADDATRVRFMTTMSYLILSMTKLDVVTLADLIDAMWMTYIMAAAAMTGNYDIPEQTDKEKAEADLIKLLSDKLGPGRGPGSPMPTPPDDVHDFIGQYL